MTTEKRAQAPVKPTPPGTHVKPTPPALFIAHDVCMETRWENMYGRGYLTPASLFFIRNHTATPSRRATTRATDTEGHTQPAPETVLWNDRGYEWGAFVAHPVVVV